MSEIKNQYYYDKYNNFINQCKNRKVPLPRRTYTEKHHILPEALFPEYADGSTIIFVDKDREIPEGYYEGVLDSNRQRAVETFKDAKHYHNPKTGKQVRSKEHPGGDFIEGRLDGYSKGNAIMNNPDYLKLYNIKDFKSELVHKDKIQDYHISSSDSKMIIAGGYLFESLALHLELVPAVPIRDLKVATPAGRQSHERREFCRNNKGKLISSFPVEIIKATEWKGDYTQYKVLTKFEYSVFNALQYKQDIFGITPKGTDNASSANE